MKGEKLVNALGKIDDKLVSGAIPVARERKRSPWPVIAAAAAVAAICLFAFPRLLTPLSGENVIPPLAQEDMTPQEAEPALQPFLTPAVSDEFPATVSQAAAMGVVLQTMEERSISPGALPVYARGGESPVPDYAAMKALARELGARLELEGEPVRQGKTVVLEAGDTITVDSAMTTEIVFAEPLPLPLAYDLTTYDGACLAATWIRANYLKDLDMEKPHTTVVGSEQTGWEVRISDTAAAHSWYQTDVGVLRFALGNGGVEKIVLRSMDTVTALGEYPIYFLRQARDRVLSGYGYCALEQPPEEPLFDSMGIVYLEFEATDVSLPFYWFSTELENGEEGLYFLPAVEEEYLKCVTWWKDLQYVGVEEKLQAIPGPEEVTQEVRRAFADFLTEMEVDDDYADYEMYFECSGAQVLLHCRGPLMVTTGRVQTFVYDSAEKTVSWGAGGVWEEDPFDAAQAIRRMLLQRSAEEHYVGYDYSECVREAVVLYFLEHKQMLQYLPVFDENTQPGREDLLLFTVLNGGLDMTFTEETLDTAVNTLLDGVTLEHGPAAQLGYEDGVYTYLPYGLADGPVYYRPETSFWRVSDNAYGMTLSGYEFWPEDFMTEAEEKSPNWQAMETWCRENQGLSGEALIEHFDAAILECLCSNEVTPEDVGLQASQQLTVYFRLQEGEFPLRFVSCERLMTCG